MGGLKQIMYGVTDFARMRAENAYFVDRTDLVRELEKTRYTVAMTSSCRGSGTTSSRRITRSTRTRTMRLTST